MPPIGQTPDGLPVHARHVLHSPYVVAQVEQRNGDRAVPAREAAVVTFLATASGMTLLGIGSAFWGLLAGVLTSVVASVGRRRRAAASAPAPQPVTAASRMPERTSA